MSKLASLPVPLFPILTLALAFGAGSLIVGSAGSAQAAAPSAAATKGAGGTSGKAAAKGPAAKAATKAPAKTGKGGTTGATGISGAGGAAAAAAPTATAVEEKPAGTAPAGASPMTELKKSNEQLDKLLKKKHPAWSPEADGQKAAVRKLVGGFLDYGELARRALAKHWDGLKPDQRKEFVTTLRDLVERSYLKQVSGDPNYNIKYEKEEKSGNEASVEGTLTTVARGKKVSLALVYKLVYKDRWVVYDVVTDEQSMLENYRAEFNKIINRDGFDTLLKRMKKKLDEDEKDE
jgi:phospholipid transport system substrate-binding protein